MNRTRAILSSGGGNAFLSSQSKFLIPTETFLESGYNSLAGAWSHLNDQSARDVYEDMVSKKVIQDTVLSQARHGSTMTMALFYNLQNPLWKKHAFDPVEFMDGVKPALESFQDTLMNLVQDMNDKNVQQNVDTAAHLLKDASGENEWKKEAKENPESLAGRLKNMVSEQNFEEQYYSIKLFHALTAGRSKSLAYKSGSGRVGQVALLRARTMEMTQARDDQEFPELAASDGTVYPIAARLDVLYEITQTFDETTTTQHAKETMPTTEEVYKSIVHPASENDTSVPDSGQKDKMDSVETRTTVAEDSPGVSNEPEDKSKEKESVTKEKVETTLAVAVLEGWLYGGPERALRWKISDIRDAYEFH